LIEVDRGFVILILFLFAITELVNVIGTVRYGLTFFDVFNEIMSFPLRLLEIKKI